MKCTKLVAKEINYCANQGVLTITVEDDKLKELDYEQKINIALATPIPVGVEYAKVLVTDGTVDLWVAKCNQYWTPETLKHCTLTTIYKSAPPVLIFDGWEAL